MLERYLRRSWRDQGEIPDLRQDAYVRVYEAALREKPFNPKHFLFQVARNLMIDRSRRKSVVSFDSFADFDGVEVDDDQPDAEQSAAARQELRLLMTAIGELPPRFAVPQLDRYLGHVRVRQCGVIIREVIVGWRSTISSGDILHANAVADDARLRPAHALHNLDVLTDYVGHCFPRHTRRATRGRP